MRCLLAALLLLGPTLSAADPIKIVTTGTATQAEGTSEFFGSVGVGTPYKAVLTYDSATADMAPDPTIGDYIPLTGDFTITVNGRTEVLANYNALVLNFDGGFESVHFLAYAPISSEDGVPAAGLGFSDAGDSIDYLATDQLSTEIDESLLRFPSRWLDWRELSGRISFSVDTLEVSRVSETTPVPEPATLSLMGGALLALAGWKMKSRQG
jgi:hypothetical protein